MSWAISILLFAGYASLAVFGTGTLMAYHWPGYIAIGLAGILGLGALKRGGARGTGAVALTAALIFAAYITVRALTSEVAYLAREDLAILAAAFVVYVLFAFRLTTVRARFSFVLLLLVLALGDVALGLYQYFGDPDFHILQLFDPYYVRKSEPSRISGFYNLSNHLAGFLSVVVLLFAAFICVGHAKTQTRLAALYGLLFLVAGMVLTGSRGGALGLLAGLCVCAGGALYLVFRLQRERLRLVLGIGAAAGLAVIVAGVFLFQGVLERRGWSDLDSQVGDVRLLHIWPAAVLQFLESPVTGTGSRSFSYHYYKYAHPRLHTDPMFAHNEHLQLLADYGAIAFLCMLVFLVAHISRGTGFLSRYAAGDLPRRKQGWAMSAALVLGALSGIVAHFFHAVVEFNFHSPPNALAVAFLFGVLVNPGPSGLPRRRSGDVLPPGVLVPQWIALVAAALAGLLLVCGGVRFSRSELLYENAKILGSRGAWEQADASLLKCVSIDPGNPNAFRALGEAQFRQLSAGNTASENTRLMESAIENLEKAAELHPYDRITRARLVVFLGMLQQFEEAGVHLRAALECAPRSKLVMLARTQFLRMQGRWREELQVYKEWLKFRPWSQDAYNGLREATLACSASFLRQGNRKAAVAVLEDYLARYPGNTQARAALKKLTPE